MRALNKPPFLFVVQRRGVDQPLMLMSGDSEGEVVEKLSPSSGETFTVWRVASETVLEVSLRLTVTEVTP